jgi:hypothetical protein
VIWRWSDICWERSGRSIPSDDISFFFGAWCLKGLEKVVVVAVYYGR